MGPRRRTRTYSFSGSERSHTATPTPSEVEGGLTEDESQPAPESANDLPQTEVIKQHRFKFPADFFTNVSKVPVQRDVIFRKMSLAGYLSS